MHKANESVRVEASLRDEADLEKVVSAGAWARLRVIERALGIRLLDSEGTDRLGGSRLGNLTKAKGATFLSLFEGYREACSLFRARQPGAFLRTDSEYRILKDIRAACPTKKIKCHTSFVIGPFVADLFFPRVKGQTDLYSRASDRTMKGLVVELDGPVHDREQKMRKDHNKIQSLARLKIGACGWSDQCLGKSTIRDIVKYLRTLPKLDSRGGTRLMRNVYLYTIASHLSGARLQQIFGFDVDAAVEKGRRK